MSKVCSNRLETPHVKSAGWLRYFAILTAAAAIAASPAMAEHTRWWRQSTFDDFTKGKAKGIALNSDGKLFLAPRFAELADANVAFLLQVRADSKGNLYVAGGSNAKVLRIDPNGRSTTVFESTELAAQALAVDASGNLFVGTSPDGKVYKVTPDGKSSVFFDPKTKYIWDLVVDKDGTVYVATGDTGKIFALAPDGKGQVFYSSDQTHIRSLVLDANGNVLAGTEPSGQVLRIPKAPANPRKAFVLYETSKKEITALLQDSNGNLYVAGVGEKTPAVPGQPRTQLPEAPASASFSVTIGPGGNAATTAPSTQPIPYTPLPTANSSSVYRIAPDGSPDELWSSRDELVYALGLLPGGKLVLGTGNQGGVIELEGNRRFSRLVNATSRQITSMAMGPGGKLFLASANPGKLYTMGPANATQGTFESQPFDAHFFSHWGRTEWWGENAAPVKNGSPYVEFYARSGNTSDPETNWSDWAGPYSSPSGDKLACPPARFVQWKVVLHERAAGATPEVDWVNVSYLPKNIAPEVTAIALQNPGIRAQSTSLQTMSGGTLPTAQLRMPQPQTSSTFNIAGISNAGASTASLHFDSSPQGFVQKGYQSVLWTAEDDNEDPLEFAVYFRGEHESEWKLLKDKVDARFYSWDTTAMPDGAYYLKVVASDAQANPAGDGLTGERVSDRFIVDNTPPAISQVNAETVGTGGIRVRFQANASATPISRAQYSVDAGDWVLVFPTGGLSDAAREDYDFQVRELAAGEHTITVRVYDQFENVSSGKATVRVSSSGN